MEGLNFLSLGSEDDYYKKFCEIYKEEIITPDGFCVICLNLEIRARHFCGGKQEHFQKGRASRIEWPKYILLNPEKRVVLRDTETNNLIFYYERNKTKYALICSEMKNAKLVLVSGFIAGEKRAKKYREGKPPYEFYKKRAVEILNNSTEKVW